MDFSHLLSTPVPKNFNTEFQRHCAESTLRRDDKVSGVALQIFTNTFQLNFAILERTLNSVFEVIFADIGKGKTYVQGVSTLLQNEGIAKERLRHCWEKAYPADDLPNMKKMFIENVKGIQEMYQATLQYWNEHGSDLNAFGTKRFAPMIEVFIKKTFLVDKKGYPFSNGKRSLGGYRLFKSAS